MLFENNEKEDLLLQDFKKSLKKRLGSHLKGFILFGSRARKDHQPDSDYDCMVLLDQTNPTINNMIDDVVGDFLFENNIVFSVLPVAEERYKKETCHPLFMNIQREGIPI